jgi:hypothetical protein
LSFRPLVYLNRLTGELAPALSRVMPEYLVYPIAGSLLAIFPTALLMGVAFPIGLRLWADGGRHTAERVGWFYSLNVAGAIVGSLAGGFVLLPRLGSERRRIHSCSSWLSDTRAPGSSGNRKASRRRSSCTGSAPVRAAGC